jgi:hypothetical protein
MYVLKYYTNKIYNGVAHSNKSYLNSVEFTASISRYSTSGVKIRGSLKV